MKSRLFKIIGIPFLCICLAIPVIAFVVCNRDVEAAGESLEEAVYEDTYTVNIADLVKVKKAGVGTDIDGNGADGDILDLTQMRNYLVGKIGTFYRTQGVSYQYHEGDSYVSAPCYYVTSHQDCVAGITKAEGKLQVLSKYDDGINGELDVKYLDDGAFAECTELTKAILPETVTQLKGNVFHACDALTTVIMPGVATLPAVATDVDSDGYDDTTGYTDGNFTDCSALQTVVAANAFTVLGSNFTASADASRTVDVYVDGVNEPRLDMGVNTCLSGKIYHYNESGMCDTWQYNNSGDDVIPAQYEHTYSEEDGVCTNECCQKQSFKGLSFEKNYILPRDAADLQVEYLEEFEGEKNVAKITTTANKYKVADVIIDLPKDVTSTMSIRLYAEQSDATFIGFQYVTLENTNPATKASNVGEAAYFSGHPFVLNTSIEEKQLQGVWMEYELDFSNASPAYGDRLQLLIQGGDVGLEHVFYVAYAVNSEEEDVREFLAKYNLEDGYLADFSSGLYEDLIHFNDFASSRKAGNISVERLAEKEDNNGIVETNVIKITTVGNTTSSAAVADFIMNMPKNVRDRAIVRLMIEDSDATHIGFQNIESGAAKYSGVWGTSGTITTSSLGDDKKGVWMDVVLDYSDTDEEYLNRLQLLVQGGAKEGTHTFYISYVADKGVAKSYLANTLAEGYLADFSSPMYVGMAFATKSTSSASVTISDVQWLPSYQGEEGVVKVTATVNSGKKAPVVIELPKAHTGSYTLKMYISSSTTFPTVGTVGTNEGFTSNVSERDQWKEVTVTKDDGYNGQYINVMGYSGTAGTYTLEFYLAWVKTSEAQ